MEKKKIQVQIGAQGHYFLENDCFEREILDDNEVLDLDAIVIAAAGLLRLGLENLITQRIPFDIISPHPLQGSLAVVTRSIDRELIGLVSVLDANKNVVESK